MVYYRKECRRIEGYGSETTRINAVAAAEATKGTSSRTDACRIHHRAAAHAHILMYRRSRVASAGTAENSHLPLVLSGGDAQDGSYFLHTLGTGDRAEELLGITGTHTLRGEVAAAFETAPAAVSAWKKFAYFIYTRVFLHVEAFRRVVENE